MASESAADLEQELRVIWEKLLGKQNISGEDDFFLLGGDSLIGAMLITSLADLAGAEISLLDLYDHPTLGSQCTLIAYLREAGHHAPA
jgi:acyl carrier protein